MQSPWEVTIRTEGSHWQEKEQEQIRSSLSVRAAGQDEDKAVRMAVPHLTASESEVVAYSPPKLSITPCFFSLHVGIEPCYFKLEAVT